VPVAKEPYSWLCTYLICAFILSARTSKKYIASGMVLGCFNTIWVVLFYSFKFHEFASHHLDVNQWVSAQKDLPASVRNLIVIKSFMTFVSGILPGTFALVITSVKNQLR